MKRVRYPTKAEIARGAEIGRAEHQYDAERMTYRPKLDAIELELVNGLRVIVPRSMVKALAELPVSVIRSDMRLDGDWGAVIQVPSRDLDISVSGFLRSLMGADWARQAGSVTSAAKTAAARENGRRGGRPRKHIPKPEPAPPRRKRKSLAS